MFVLEIIENLHALHVELEPTGGHLGHFDQEGNFCFLYVLDEQFQIPCVVVLSSSIEIQLLEGHIEMRKYGVKHLAVADTIATCFDLRVVSLH